jgi:hypothetical protein
MTIPLTVECNLRLPGRGQERYRSIPGPINRVPRISRLMALAIKMEHLVRVGGIANYSELAQLGHVSRARITQILNLLLLAPDIQEQILFLPGNSQGRDPIHLVQLQPIARILNWSRQRLLWDALLQNRMKYAPLLPRIIPAKNGRESA